MSIEIISGKSKKLLSRPLRSNTLQNTQARHCETMVADSEHNLTTTRNSMISNDGKKTLDAEKGASPDIGKVSPPLHTALDPAPDDTEITYPEGGRDAWLVVLGAFCGLMASLGIYNTAGVFEVVVSKVILPEKSPSTIGWIFSTCE